MGNHHSGYRKQKHLVLDHFYSGVVDRILGLAHCKFTLHDFWLDFAAADKTPRSWPILCSLRSLMLVKYEQVRNVI